jgi:hypothetical protein
LCFADRDHEIQDKLSNISGHNVLVDVDTEGQRDLPDNSTASPKGGLRRLISTTASISSLVVLSTGRRCSAQAEWTLPGLGSVHFQANRVDSKRSIKGLFFGFGQFGHKIRRK